MRQTYQYFFVNVLVLCAAKHSLPCITAQQATETGGSKSSKEPSPAIGREEEVPKQKSDERSDPHESEKASPARMVSAVSDDVEVDTATQQRAMSPGTLALMCDEKDPLFTAPPRHQEDFVQLSSVTRLHRILVSCMLNKSVPFCWNIESVSVGLLQWGSDEVCKNIPM
jgi:hypothetical protein